MTSAARRGLRIGLPGALVLALAALLLAGLSARAYAANGFALAEGRQWEQVSPVNKHGVAIPAQEAYGNLIQASESGNAITYGTEGPPVGEPQGNRSAELSQVYSTRTPGSGWQSVDMASPNSEVAGLNLLSHTEFKMFSSNLSVGLVEPLGATPLPPLAASAEKTIYIRNAQDGSYVPLVTSTNVRAGAKFGVAKTPDELKFDGASSDFSNVVFSSEESLTPEMEPFAPNGHPNLYEWHDGEIQLVSILPDGDPASAEESTAALGLENGITRNAVLDNGVIWSAKTSEDEYHLYFWSATTHRSTQLDVPEHGVAGGESTALYQGASRDGSLIFFTDEHALTSNSHAKNSGSPEPDLYVYETASASLTDLTVDTHESEGEAESANVEQDIIGTSEDGSYVYFVAQGVLTPGASPGNNLYVEHLTEDGWSTPILIASLSNADVPDWDTSEHSPRLLADLVFLSARVSPSGRYLAFMSDEELTGYDNEDLTSASPGEKMDEEVYEYDAATNRLVCASCDPSGARPEGVFDTGKQGVLTDLFVDQAEIWSEQGHGDPWLAASVPGWTTIDSNRALYQPRYLNNSGQLFFDSPSDLVPAAGNGKEDVYQYRPAGEDCSGETQSQGEVYKPQSVYKNEAGEPGEEPAGCVSLLSGGKSGEESAFLDASESGNDVFFLTKEQLVSQDIDTSYDVYDAHVCSGEAPCPSSVSVPPACTNTESCRAAAPQQPGAFAAPTSATFSGQGNATPTPVAVVPKAKPLTRAQKLTAALKVCKRDKRKAKRAACEKTAHAKYGPVKQAKQKKKS